MKNQIELKDKENKKHAQVSALSKKAAVAPQPILQK